MLRMVTNTTYPNYGVELTHLNLLYQYINDCYAGTPLIYELIGYIYT